MYKQQNVFLKMIRSSLAISIFIWLLFVFVIRVNNFDLFHSVPNIDSTRIIFENPKFNIDIDVSQEHDEIFKTNSELEIESESVIFQQDTDVASGRIFYDNVPLMYQTDYPDYFQTNKYCAYVFHS